MKDKELEILAAFIETQEVTEEVNLCSVSNKKQVVLAEPENKLDELIKNNLTIENF